MSRAKKFMYFLNISEKCMLRFLTKNKGHHTYMEDKITNLFYKRELKMIDIGSTL